MSDVMMSDFSRNTELIMPLLEYEERSKKDFANRILKPYFILISVRQHCIQQIIHHHIRHLRNVVLHHLFFLVGLL
jgi:hypothetical protein